MAMDFYFFLLFLLISIAATTSTTPPSEATSHVDNRQLHVTLRQSTNSGQAVELWCVAKNNAEDSALQSALDWACGVGGADCGPIQQNGPCYDSSDLERTASYAFNDYFLKHGLTEDSCNFDNTASLTSLNPSYNSCKFPSSSTGKNRSVNGSSIAGIGGPASADLSGNKCVGGRRGWVAVISIPLFISITLNLQ